MKSDFFSVLTNDQGNRRYICWPCYGDDKRHSLKGIGERRAVVVSYAGLMSITRTQQWTPDESRPGSELIATFHARQDEVREGKAIFV